MTLFTPSKMPVLILAVLFFSMATGHAQKFKYSIPGLDSLEKSFIVNGGASTVLKSGEAEIIWNNTLSSYWLALHQNGKNSPILDRFRLTRFTSDLYGFYGISPSGRWDIGLQMRYVRTRLDNAASSSMFRVFQASNKAEINADPFSSPSSFVLDESFGGITNAGLRCRFKPFKLRPELIITGGYSISTVKDETDQIQLAAGRDIADIGASYYKELTRNAFYFFSVGGLVYFPSNVRNVEPNDVRDEYLFSTNFNFFLIQRTNNNKFTFYPGLSYGFDFKPSQFDSKGLIKTQEFLFAYAGVQYAPTLKYNIFLTAGLPLIMDIKSVRSSIIRESYSILSLGARTGF